jgi:mannose/fructose/N-acetylgalactosamine-specific phosphotransferase system component IID
MRLDFVRFIKIFFSSLFIQTSWSFFAKQEMGFLVNLITGTSKDKKEKILKKHKGLFNTHPYMASYIIGATIRAYDEKQDFENINRFIAIAQASFASAGDLLFWQTIRPALLLISVILGIKFGIIGPFVFIITYSIFHLYHRAKGITDGYNMGWDVIFLLKSKRITTAQHAFEILGAFFSGLLICLISIKFNYLLLIPLTALFIVLLIRRYSAFFIIVSVLLLLIIIVMV